VDAWQVTYSRMESHNRDDAFVGGSLGLGGLQPQTTFRDASTQVVLSGALQMLPQFAPIHNGDYTPASFKKPTRAGVSLHLLDRQDHQSAEQSRRCSWRFVPDKSAV